MSKFKEKLGIYNNNYLLTIEQEEIENEIINLINNKSQNKIIIQINSQVGDGKTFLLNSILLKIKNQFKFYNEFTFTKDENQNIGISQDLVIIDNYNDKDISILKKYISLYNIIIFSCSNQIELFNDCNKYNLNHKYRLKYLNINDTRIAYELRNLETYSFYILKQLIYSLKKDIRKNDSVDKKNEFLFYQKKLN